MQSIHAYRRAFDRVLANLGSHADRLANERAQAPQLAAELAARMPAHADLLVRNVGRFATPAVADELLRSARKARRWAPVRAEQLASMALAIAKALPEDGRPIGDVTAPAWVEVGRARCQLGRERAAARALVKALAALDEGSGDPVDRARAVELEAEILARTGRSSEAIACMARAVADLRRIGDNHAAGEALVATARIAENAGEPDRGAVFLARALTLLDAAEAPRAPLDASFALVRCLEDAGRALAAWAHLVDARGQALEVGDATDLARLDRIGGRLALALEMPRQAERMLRRAADTYFSERDTRRGLAASLDLARLLLEERRPLDLARLAASLERELTALGAPSPTHERVAQFRQAAEAREATVTALDGLRASLGLGRG